MATKLNPVENYRILKTPQLNGKSSSYLDCLFGPDFPPECDRACLCDSGLKLRTGPQSRYGGAIKQESTIIPSHKLCPFMFQAVPVHGHDPIGGASMRRNGPRYIVSYSTLPCVHLGPNKTGHHVWCSTFLY